MIHLQCAAGESCKMLAAILCTEKIDDWGHDNEKIRTKPLALLGNMKIKYVPHMYLVLLNFIIALH